MARIIVLVMVIVVGLWVVGQAFNAKRVVEKHHATLMSMMEVIEK